MPSKAIIPKGKLFDASEFDRAMENALTGTSLDIHADFEVTTLTWSEKSKPDFKIERAKFLRRVFTESEIYGYVDEGTDPHTIKAKPGINPKTKRPYVLAFSVPFVPKTRPFQVRSGKGFKGGQPVFTTEVNHPGTKARNFVETIGNKWEREFPQNMQRAIDSAF